MTFEDIKRIISTDETRTLELKKSTGELKDGMHSACAFLNTDGGWLIFGIAPKSLKILGQQVTDDTRREIAQAIRGLEPAIDVHVYDIDVPDRPGNKIIAMHFDGWVWGMKPYTFHGCPYIRIESTTSVMPSEIYEERFRECQPMEHSWENLTTLNGTLEDIDENRIMGIVRAGIRDGRMPETALEETIPSLLNRWGLLSGDKPTNGAMALFARNAGNYPQLKIKMAEFSGTEPIDFLDNQQIDGNIFEQLDAAMSFCFRHLNLRGKVVGLKRNDELEIPYEALREGIINSLCHRRYDDYRESIQLGIYSDRVEICNPGRFPAGVTPENIKALHSSKPRNLHIAQVMYKASYLEGWGTGITRMINVCKAHNLPEPSYEIWADGTIVLVFQRPKTANSGEKPSKMTENEIKTVKNDGKSPFPTIAYKAVYDALIENPKAKYEQLEIYLGLSESSIQRAIKWMKENGYIDAEHSKVNGIWQIR